MNDENLKPIRSESEAREKGQKGGKASGEARRRKANFRKTLNLLLTTKIDSPEWTPILESLGLESTLESAVNAAMIKEALLGNVKAFEAIAKYSGQTALTEEQEKNLSADTGIKQAKEKVLSGSDEKEDLLKQAREILGGVNSVIE